MEGIASPGRLRTTALVLLMCLFLCLAKEDKRTNVLLIMFDDLRPQLSIYGKEYMITPNFERLAKRSVVFDNALCQVAVCNPSRNSFLTGLRPDTTGSYNFETSILPHIPFPALLVNHGYNTAASGKIEHSRLATEKYADAATTEKTIWSHECWENGWYKYQGSEKQLMNSSVTPDKKELEDFRDWQYTTRTLQHIRHLSALPQPFLSAIGFKLPHLELHVPHKYFSMYKDKAPEWKLSKRELKFPSSVSEISYRCCAEGRFRFMNNEGSEVHNHSHPLLQIDKALPNQMHDELMMGYSAGITYLDDQLGRILDLLDELHLWDNTTVILTSDHGMHNGEKGIWEKWTLFEESLRVPLIISHPRSPFQGQRYSPPVETLDVFPTIVELMGLTGTAGKKCKGWYCHPLDGKSLAGVVLGVPEKVAESASKEARAKAGKVWNKWTLFDESLRVPLLISHPRSPFQGQRYAPPVESIDVFPTLVELLGLDAGLCGGWYCHPLDGKSLAPVLLGVPEAGGVVVMPHFAQDFAMSQVIRCAPRSLLPPRRHLPPQPLKPWSRGSRKRLPHQRAETWRDCNMLTHKERWPSELSLMGYSMRTLQYRYTAYYPFNRTLLRPDPLSEPYEEELFDHKNESLSDFTHRETVNLAYKPSYAGVVRHYRAKMANFLLTVAFRNPSPY
eukprot:CAMPEP_0173268066 /NCGR_PEP_ID=MMETSP1142-20121109/30119_1 /TAXON_ID=483371 /ORGANISM="non described non described, Strain CCMP2298" /LENGTH=674 /DNA_ID=CAMNT_0014204265 /DNA_START=104 /DNA_END=2128 /DNA_ORIENTATION=-